MDTIVPTVPTRTGLRPAGRLLAATPLISIVFIVVAGVTMPVDTSFDLTPDQMADIRLGWIAMNVLWAAAVLVGAAGLALLGGALRSTPARRLATVSQAAVAVGAASILGNLVLSLSVTGFTEDRLGLNGTRDLATQLSLVAYWAMLVATVLTGIALWVSGVLRRTGLVVAILAGLFLAADVVTWLPGLTGSVPVQEAGGLPPMLVSLFWLAFGIGLLRRRVPSTHDR